MYHGIRWTHTEIDLLKKMFSEGYSIRKIASVLGRSASSVNAKARDENIIVRKLAEWDIRAPELIQLREDGLSFAEIGDQMGCSENSVRCAYYRYRKHTKRNTGALVLKRILLEHCMSSEDVDQVLSELQSAGVYLVK